MKFLAKSYTLLPAIMCLVFLCSGTFAYDRDYHPGDRPGDRNEFRETGTIANIDAPGDKLILKTRYGSYDIAIDRTVVKLENGRSIRLDDLGHGDEVTVVGDRIQHNKMIARTITVISFAKSYKDSKPDVIVVRGKYQYHPDKGRCDSIEGKVVKTAGTFNRTIVVDTRYGDITVKVEKGAMVRRDRRDISVHDIRGGEIVVVSGQWDHEQIVSNRVEVLNRQLRPTSYRPDDRYEPRDH